MKTKKKAVVSSAKQTNKTAPKKAVKTKKVIKPIDLAKVPKALMPQDPAEEANKSGVDVSSDTSGQNNSANEANSPVAKTEVLAFSGQVESLSQVAAKSLVDKLVKGAKTFIVTGPPGVNFTQIHAALANNPASWIAFSQIADAATYIVDPRRVKPTDRIFFGAANNVVVLIKALTSDNDRLPIAVLWVADRNIGSTVVVQSKAEHFFNLMMKELGPDAVSEGPSGDKIVKVAFVHVLG